MSYLEKQLWNKGQEGTWLLSECIWQGGQKKFFSLKVYTGRGKNGSKLGTYVGSLIKFWKCQRSETLKWPGTGGNKTSEANQG